MQTCKYHIAVLDDGIYDGLFYIPPLENNLEVLDNKIVTKVNQNEKNKSHGTICAAIMYKYNPCIKLTSIKVLDDDNKKGDVKDLVQAVEWCIDHSVDVIHLSIGSVCIRDCAKIDSVIKKAVKKNIIIVAAQNNKMLYTYPASLCSVIGVRHTDAYMQGEYEVRWYPFDGIEILTSSRHRLALRNGEYKILQCSNSFAAPYITALVCAEINKLAIMRREINKENLLSELQKKAIVHRGEMYKGYTMDIVPFADRGISKEAGIDNSVFWDSKLYDKIIRAQFPFCFGEIEIPIINLHGDDKGTLFMLIKKILVIFFQHQIEFCGIATSYLNYIFNFEILPESIDILKFFNAMVLKFDPDLFFVYGEMKEKADLEIKLSFGKFQIYCQESGLTVVKNNMDSVISLLEQFF